jgi:hypothetical protein
VLCDLSAYEGMVVKFRFRFGARGQQPTGEGWYVDDVDLLYMGPAGVAEHLDLGRLLRVEQAQPNPFGRSVTIRYGVSREVPVVAEVVDLSGRTVIRRDLGLRGAGAHEFLWDGADDAGRHLPDGVYFYRVRCGGESASGRITLLR